MKFTNKTFTQSCRYGKYLIFATLVTPITDLGAEQFAFPCNVFFAKLQLKKFWAWAETKTGLCWGRKTAKASDAFQTCWIFNMFTCSNSIPRCVLAIGIMGLIMNMWTCWRSKMFEKRQIGKLVQHREIFKKPLARLVKRCCKSKNTNCNTYIKLTAATTAPRWCCQKIYHFTKKGKKTALKEKIKFFFSAFSHFNNFFGTHSHLPAIFNFLDLLLSALSHSQSPCIPKHAFKV